MTKKRNRIGRPKLSCELLEDRRVLAQLLPDLFAWEGSNNNYLHNYRIEGDLLRFSTALANQGEGNLEIRGGNPLPNGNQEVFQRIFNDDGSWEDRLAGEFTYHPGHSHIHFDGYAIYNLRAKLPNGTPGDVVATGGKISFCLIDITPLPGTSNSSQYGGCGATRQGISAGWSDVYGSSLSDQWVNIAGIVDGEYFLEVIVDPDDQLVESDETNNTTIVPVLIDRGGTGGGGDVYEPNNSFGAASDLGLISYLDQPGLSIHTSSDVDYFRIEAAADGPFTAEILFTNSLGDLDLFVYDSNQQLLDSSTSVSDLEIVEWDALDGESYFVKVEGWNGATNGYDLELNGPGEIQNVATSSDDPALPILIPDNQSPGITSTLEGPDLDLTDVNLVLNSLTHTYVGDLDMWLTSPAGTTVQLLDSFRYLGSEDNFINTVMDDQAPTFLGDGTAPFSGSFNISHSSVGDNPLSTFNGENAAGTWTIRVQDSAGSDVGALNAWGIQFAGFAPDAGDRYEPNNDFPFAIDLGTLGSASEYGLSIHNAADVDFFRFNALHTGTATVDLLFLQAEGNLELVVYDETLTEVARGNSVTDNENLFVDAEAGRLYYVAVLGAGGATNNAYTLNINVAAPSCDADGDGACSTQDLRGLYDNIALATPGGIYDIDGSGSVDNADITAWLADAGAYNGQTYIPGDVDLDGEVNGSDFTAVAANFGGVGLPGAYWDNGNFNGISEGEFSVGGDDFTSLAANFGFLSPPILTAAPSDVAKEMRVLGDSVGDASVDSRTAEAAVPAVAEVSRERPLEADRHTSHRVRQDNVLDQVFAEL